MNEHDTGSPDPSNIPLPMSRAQTPARDQNPLPPKTTNDSNQSRAVVEETNDMNIDSDPATRNMPFEKFYCLLELISEQGSGGLVDKVIIAQESLGRFINKLRPGAYSSLTKVDFKALDSCLVQPIGVYGSRHVIVAFLLDICIINDRQAVELLSADDDDMYQEILKPGLYIVLPSQATSRELYIIFWPEKDTWRDDAISSVRRNRVTFIRYLTKITHQILCLFTEEESRSFVWNSETESAEVADDNEAETDDRMFTFEVAKTLEQQEDVATRPGFVFAFPPGHLKAPSAAVVHVSERAIVLSGECSQGLLTVHFVKPKLNEEWIRNKSMNLVQLTDFL